MTRADPDLAGTLAARLDRAAQARLGRSLALFAAPVAECGGCTLELQALRGTLYRLARLGLGFVGTPAQADVLLVSGALTGAMAEPLRRAWEAASDPKWVVGIGDCAGDGGLFRGAYPVLGGIGEAVPVDLLVPGCPPSPAAVLQALAALVEANA